MKYISRVLSFGFSLTIAVTLAGTAQAQLLITEIMFDPFGNNEHEYVELFNTTSSDINLSNYSLQVNGFDNKLADGSMIAADGIAVIVRTDNVARPLQNYIDAWGADINFIETDGEGGLPFWQVLSNTGSNVEIIDELFNVVVGVFYDADTTPDPPWPGSNNMSSIYLTDINAVDPSDGANWALSADGVDGAHFGNPPRAGDLGSPGFIQGVSVVPNADFDSDNDVDGDDFLAWQRGFGSGSPTLADGDANGDGMVDGADLAAWEQQYGSVVIVPALENVPEPTCCLLLLTAGLFILAQRNRSI
jgi:hypothetical protein